MLWLFSRKMFTFFFTHFHFYPQFILKLSHPLTRAALLVFHASLFILSLFSKLGTGIFKSQMKSECHMHSSHAVNTVDRTILSKTMAVAQTHNCKGKIRSVIIWFWYLYDHHLGTWRALLYILKLLSYGLSTNNSNNFLESMHNALYFTTSII